MVQRQCRATTGLLLPCWCLGLRRPLGGAGLVRVELRPDDERAIDDCLGERQHVLCVLSRHSFTGGFYQIAPINDTSADGTARLAPFIKDFEIPRRTKYIQNILTCSGAGCSAGAEATFL